jgi:hypothetical protein
VGEFPERPFTEREPGTILENTQRVRRTRATRSGVGRGVTARRRLVPLGDEYRTLTSAEVLRDRHAAELPPGYDLVLEFTSDRICLTAKGPGLRERECVDVAPDAAETTSLFRRLAATAKFHDRVRRAAKSGKSGRAG